MRRGPVYLAVVIGIGLIAAPGIFKMFSRAPLGGQMLDELGPFMSTEVVQKFRGHLGEIDRAEAESRDRVRPLLAGRRGLGDPDQEFDRTFPGIAELNRRWPGIRQDMTGMLDTMEDNLDNFAAVDALPPFPLFPWFFVAPGLIVAALGWSALRADRRGIAPRWRLRSLVVMGLGLIAAPAIFQMFTRAPLGGQMITDFRPLMTTERVTTVQQYFLVIGVGEGELRTKARPLAEQRLDMTDADYATQLPAITELGAGWPRISGDMAPMVGAMSDNVDNFQAVDALPPFPLFPWFFVVPGVLITVLALAAGRKGAQAKAAAGVPAGINPERAPSAFEHLRQQGAARKASQRPKESKAP